MKHITVKLKENTVIGVIGDIHEHEEQFDEMVEKFGPSEDRILVSAGDILDKGFGKDVGFSIIRKMSELDNFYCVAGNHDFKHARKAIRAGRELGTELQWIDNLPWAISFVFPNGKSILVLHGGITPKNKYEDLGKSEVMYVKTVDEDGEMIPMKRKTINGKIVLSAARPGRSWHELYDGRFGYICSGHDAQRDGRPKYYGYSCNVDTACYHTGILTCQTFDQKGLNETLYVYGRPYVHQPSASS